MKCAAYARSAVRGQEAEEIPQINSQIQRIEAWAKDNGFILVGKYFDAGTSALDYNRSSFQRIIHDATSPRHPFDMIIVTEYSRIFRDWAKFQEYKNILKNHKVELISITQPIPCHPRLLSAVKQISKSLHRYLLEK